jgi:hypothetical protein
VYDVDEAQTDGASRAARDTHVAVSRSPHTDATERRRRAEDAGS